MKILWMAAFAAGLTATAGQIREVKMNPIPFAGSAPVIDGELNEWSGAARVRIAPIPPSEDAMLKSAAQTGSFRFPANVTATTFAMQYDSKNLYIGLDWADPSPAVNPTPADRPADRYRGDAATLALAGAVRAEIALWPVNNGKSAALWIRRDGKWFRPEGGAVKVSVRPNRSGWGMEAAIPWKALTGKAEPPAGKIISAWEFSWSGLGIAELSKLNEADLRAHCHTSMSVLTAKPEFQLNPHLPRPGQWGNLHFGAGRDAVRTVSNPIVSDVTDLGCPETEKIRIDGKLDDWKNGVWADFAQLGSLPDRTFSGRLATAFDREYFYAAAVFRHHSGKPYNFAPASSGAGYGGGDALQFRISDGKAFKASVCAWLDSHTGKGAMTVDGTAHGFKSFLDRGGQIAFGSAPGGYAVELRIPWKALLNNRVNPPKSGDVWRATFQPWWRFGTNAFRYLTDFHLSAPPPLAVRYSMPRDGYLSLGVFSPDGTLIRQLVKHGFRAKGGLSEPWDGKDQFGQFVKPGTYTVKGIVTDEIKGVYAFTVGNPGNPPWPTADNHGDWLSDEAPPQAMATDGENVYVAAPGSEKGFAVMKLDKNGRRIWGVDEPFFPRCVSLSCRDGKLYGLYSGPELTDNSMKFNGKNAVGRAVLICYDAKTGERTGFSIRSPRTVIARWPYRGEVTPLWELIAKQDFRPGKYIGQPRYWDVDMGETTNAIGLAVTAKRAAVSKLYENKLEFFDPVTARKTGEMTLERPAGLHALPDGSILAVSGETVVRVSPDNRVTPVIRKGLDAPVAVTADKAGNLYVSDWGKAMQVKVFDRNGKFLRAIGKTGGRPWLGNWDGTGMLLPHGIAVTGNGDLWVAEADMIPKRISVWNTATGKLRRDWTGPTPYGGGIVFWMDPAEPELVHTTGCVYRLDWKTGKSRILRSEFRRMSGDQPFVPNGSNCLGSATRTLTVNGKKFLAVPTPRGGQIILRREGDRYIPAAAIGGLHRWTTDDGTGESAWDSDIGRHLYKNRRPPVFKGHSGDNYAWSDLNGDGLVQANEMTWAPTLTRGQKFGDGSRQSESITPWGGSCDPKGNLYFSGFCRDADAVYRVAPVRWTKFGPVYDIRKATVFHKFESDGRQVVSGIYSDSNGRIHVAADVPGRRGYPAGGQLKFAAASFSPEGREHWKIAAPADMGEQAFAASNFCGEWKIPGIGPVLGTWNWWWNFRPYFISADGLYLGTALEDTKLGPQALWSESSTYYFQAPDGTPYLVNGANQAHHFIRIEGLKNASRFSGTTAVAAADLVRARQAAEIKTVLPPPRPEIVMNQFAAAPEIDGDLTDWNKAVFVELDGGKGRAARMALGRSGDNLLLAADVSDPTPMRQTGSDFQTLFTTGDVVDLMLAVDPKADKNRRQAAPGDLRLAISELGGKPVAGRGGGDRARYVCGRLGRERPVGCGVSSRGGEARLYI